MRRMLVTTGIVWLLVVPATALADDLGVALTTPLDGAVVTGVVPLAAETVGPALTLTFEVAPDGGAWTLVATDATPADGWTADWDTAGWDGPVTIRATASDGAATASASARVNVDNLPPEVVVRLTNRAFSPNEDGRADRTGIELVLSEPASLSLGIEGSVGTVRLLLEAEPTLAGPSKVRWRGQDDSGKTVRDGRYVVRVDAVDAVGNLASAQAVVVVDTRAPIVAWGAIAPEPYLGDGDVRFTYRARDRAPTLLVRGSVTDAEGRPIATLAAARVASGEHRLSWDGSTRNGPRVEPGLRHVEVTVRDDAGNVSTTPPEPFRDHRPVVAEVLRRVEGTGGRVALTFDDCFDASSWGRILDILHGRHAGASFFCLGPYVRAYPELARRTVAEGHTVGGHGWDHADVRRLDEDQIASRLHRETDAWWDVARVTPVPYFRPPYGGLDADAARAIGRGGFAEIVLWDVDPQDWTLPGSDAIAERVLAHVRSGSIVVLHARDQTARMLPGLIDRLRARALEPVTLAELLER